MSGLIQTILFGVILLIIGLYVVSIPDPQQPYLFPAIGVVFIAGGVIAFITMFRN